MAHRDIYAAAIILNKQGDIVVKTDINNIYFNGRTTNEVDKNRLTDCINDAKNSLNDEYFPGGEFDAGFSSSGPGGYSNGHTLITGNDNMHYLIVYAKFYNKKLAIKSMIERYIETFLLMAIFCFATCVITLNVINKDLYSKSEEVVEIVASNEE